MKEGKTLAPSIRTSAGETEGGGLSSMSKVFLTIYGRLATHPKLFALSQKFAWLGTALVSPFSEYVRLPALTGWGYSKDLPRFAGRTFRERWNGNRVNTHTSKQVARDLATEKRDASVAALALTVPASIGEGDPARVKRFITELSKVNGNVIQTSAKQLTNVVLEFLQSRGVDWIHLEPNILDEEKLSQAGIRLSHAADAGIRVGVTRAICGLADTGSILEADGDGGKLQASLLPEIHLAVLNRSAIFLSMSDAIHLTRNTNSAVFITGPSRTADIEMTLTIGVHGPGEVHVFLVDD